jgi:hypothetical protein
LAHRVAKSDASPTVVPGGDRSKRRQSSAERSGTLTAVGSQSGYRAGWITAVELVGGSA